jgi:hypothetical protein
MNPKLLDPDAWKAAAKRFNLQDNGLLKALSLLDGLEADEHAERIKILKATYDLAQKMKKSKEVLASPDATKYVVSIIAECDAEAKGEAAAAAKAASEKPPGLSELKAAAKTIAALPDITKLWKGLKNECWGQEVKVQTARAFAIAAAVALAAASAAEGPSAGTSTAAAIEAAVVLVGALAALINALVDLVKCYEDHPDIPRERLKQAKDMLETFRKFNKLVEDKAKELKLWAKKKGL